MSFRKSPGEPPELTGRAEPSLCTWASFCSRPGTRGAWSQLRGPCYVWIVDKQGILVSISTFQILRVNSYSKKKKKSVAYPKCHLSLFTWAPRTFASYTWRLSEYHPATVGSHSPRCSSGRFQPQGQRDTVHGADFRGKETQITGLSARTLRNRSAHPLDAGRRQVGVRQPPRPLSSRGFLAPLSPGFLIEEGNSCLTGLSQGLTGQT